MKKLIYLSVVVLALASCSKEPKGTNIYPIFFPTDMLFEDFTLDRFSQRVPDAPFTTGPATFNVKKTGATWTGFAISNRTFRGFVTNEANLDSTKYSVYTGSGPNATGNFLVANAVGTDAFVTFSRPLQLNALLLAPTTYLYQTIMYGQGATVSGVPQKTWAPGTTAMTVARKDYCRVIIKGYNGETHTGDVIFYFADRNSVDGKRNFTRTDWMPVDVSSLGKVTRIVFEFDSSDRTAGVINTPAYFCIDGLRFDENIY
jgi:hypothetical protein